MRPLRRRWPSPRGPRIRHRLSSLQERTVSISPLLQGWPGCGFFSRPNRGRTYSKPTWLRAEVSFLEVVGRTASLSCWLLAEGLPDVATGFVKASKGGSLLRRQT